VYKQADWECRDCREDFTSTVNVPHGDVLPLSVLWPAFEESDRCPWCGGVQGADKLLSAPAKYMGECVRNPVCYGGDFDTAGHEMAPQLPRFDAAADHRRKLSAAIGALPSDASHDEQMAIHREHSRDAPRVDDWKGHFSQAGYGEIEEAREEVATRNKTKRKRLAALKQGGNVNMRRDKVSGDPKI